MACDAKDLIPYYYNGQATVILSRSARDQEGTHSVVNIQKFLG